MEQSVHDAYHETIYSVSVVSLSKKTSTSSLRGDHLGRHRRSRVYPIDRKDRALIQNRGIPP